MCKIGTRRRGSSERGILAPVDVGSMEWKALVLYARKILVVQSASSLHLLEKVYLHQFGNNDGNTGCNDALLALHSTATS